MRKMRCFWVQINSLLSGKAEPRVSVQQLLTWEFKPKRVCGTDFQHF